jgi:tetratricopeptide (TPR) repeat protein
MQSRISSDIEDARMASLSGDYQAALEIIDVVLEKFPLDIEALRLKGNTIELKVLAEMTPVSTSVRAVEIAAARDCYEKILEQEPNDLQALRDLADHVKNFGRRADAIVRFRELIDLLRDEAALGRDVQEDLADAIEEFEELMAG